MIDDAGSNLFPIDGGRTERLAQILRVFDAICMRCAYNRIAKGKT